MRLAIGVMGASGGNLVEKNSKKAFDVGKMIAEHGCVLINGATTGLPYEAAKGAKAAGGLVFGISPAVSKKEHVERYNKPLDNTDAIVYTGYGFAARNILNIRSSDAVIILPGGPGTLTEFSAAYEEGKILGVLAGAGGIADAIPAIIKTLYRKTDSVLIFEKDPSKLVEKVIAEAAKRDIKAVAVQGSLDVEFPK